MVFDTLRSILVERYGCDPADVTMAASFDNLNVLPGELGDIALELEEVFGVPVSDDVLVSAETVEDIVGYIEDNR